MVRDGGGDAMSCIPRGRIGHRYDFVSDYDDTR